MKLPSDLHKTKFLDWGTNLAFQLMSLRWILFTEVQIVLLYSCYKNQISSHQLLLFCPITEIEREHKRVLLNFFPRCVPFIFSSYEGMCLHLGEGGLEEMVLFSQIVRAKFFQIPSQMVPSSWINICTQPSGIQQLKGFSKVMFLSQLL